VIIIVLGKLKITLTIEIMKNKFLSLSLIIFLFSMIFSSCKTDNIRYYKNNIEIKVVPETSIDINLSEIAESINYVKLESTADSYFSNVWKMSMFMNRFYIHDLRSIFCFDFTGKFQFKVGRKGKGPGEYLEITDFLINSYFESIEILDARRRKIIRFDLEGKFIDEISISLNAKKFAINDKISYYIYAYEYRPFIGEDNIFNLYRITRDGKNILSTHFPFNKNLDGAKQGEFCNFDNILSFQYSRCDTIFTFNNEGERESGYFVNFGETKTKYLHDLEKQNKSDPTASSSINNYIGHIRIANILSSRDYFYMYCHQVVKFDKSLHHKLLYSRLTGKSINWFDIVNDIDGIPIGNMPSYFTSGNELVLYVNLEKILKEMENNQSPEFIKTIETLKPINVNDNVVFAFVKLKKF